ncbi:UNVERIFIED_ORG: hypothetical protein GGD59_005709 [Rhizobium esperanzae]
MYLDPSIRRAILPLKAKVVDLFDEGNWLEIATITDTYSLVTGHNRLLRSLSFGDADYGSSALAVLNSIIERDPNNFQVITEYVDQLSGGGTSLSNVTSTGPRYYIQPTVFKIPPEERDAAQVAVMMPFSPQFNAVYESIKRAASLASLSCRRADDIWQDSVLIQDIFALIVRSRIVVCDFSTKNPNVFYEAGIAHT